MALVPGWLRALGLTADLKTIRHRNFTISLDAIEMRTLGKANRPEVRAAALMLAKILGIVQWSWWTVTAPLWIVPVFIGVSHYAGDGDPGDLGYENTIGILLAPLGFALALVTAWALKEAED